MNKAETIEDTGTGADASPVKRLVSGSPNDIWYTPDHIAADMVAYFNPVGRILDPCRGKGAFTKFMPTADWCEIAEGKDFYDWHDHVNWIVSNPPYSTFTKFHSHALKVADNIVWLIPLHKPFGSWPRMQELMEWGWIKHIRIYGRSRSYGLDVGYVCGAVHFKKGHSGNTEYSFYR